MNALTSVFLLVSDISWRTACLIAVIFAFRSLLQGRVPSRLFFWAWIAVAVRLLLLFAVPTAWSPFGAPRLIRFTPADDAGHRTASASLSPVALVRPLQPASPSAIAGGPSLVSAFFEIAALGWAIGFAVLAASRLVAEYRFGRRLRLSGASAGSALMAIVGEVGRELAVGPIEVVVTEAVVVPAVHGIVRPQLLFPAGFAEKLSRSELRSVVAHELGHCRYRDLAAHALLHAARMLHWFNPLVWLAVRAARSDCEMACDEFVLRRLSRAEPGDYGATLLRIAGMAGGAPSPPGALGIAGQKRQIKKRLQMIAAYRAPATVRTLAGGALLAIALGLGMTRESRGEEAALEKAAAPVVKSAAPGVDGAQPVESTRSKNSSVIIPPKPGGVPDRKSWMALRGELARSLERAGLAGPRSLDPAEFGPSREIVLPPLSMAGQSRQEVDLNVTPFRNFQSVPHPSLSSLETAAQQRITDRLNGVLDGSLKVMVDLRQLRHSSYFPPDDPGWRMANGLPDGNGSKP